MIVALRFVIASATLSSQADLKKPCGNPLMIVCHIDSVCEVSKTFSRNILKSKNANRDIAIVFNYLNITKEALSKYSKEKSVIASECEARAWQSIVIKCQKKTHFWQNLINRLPRSLDSKKSARNDKIPTP